MGSLASAAAEGGAVASPSLMPRVTPARRARACICAPRHWPVGGDDARGVPGAGRGGPIPRTFSNVTPCRICCCSRHTPPR
eukprot:scaffold237_cov421-Prasinococcus_capsulatus_cf.AAC.23